MRLGLWFVSATLMMGCSGSELALDTEDFIDQDPPPSNCSAGTSAEPCPNAASSGNPVGGSCIDSSDCMGSASCVAPFEDGQVGDFTCTDQCLPNLDPDNWCYDAASCCNSSSICRRGLCVPDDGELDSSGSSAGETSSGTAGSDGAGSGTRGGSTGSGSTGTDSGGASSGTGMR